MTPARTAYTPSSQACEPLSAGVAFKPGMHVRLQGLKSASAQAFNAKEGVIDHFDASSGRWKVVLASGDRMLVKEENLLKM